MDKGKKPESYMIGQDDIRALFAGNPELELNSGSAFYKVTPAGGAGTDRKAAYGELLADHSFLRAARIVAQPDLSGTIRVAGPQGLTEIRLHRRKSEGEYMAATQQDADGSFTISVFADYKAWLGWWTQSFASTSDVPAANYLPPTVSLEEFMFVLHAVDSFRRISYQNMLDHVFTDRVYVRVPEFLRSMADAIKSLDARWLLPAFLAVTPGVEQYQTAIDTQNIAVLLQHDFFTEGKLASGENVLVFGEAGQIMGVEFFRSWFTSCGLEINAAGAEGFKTAERLFIAPTLLGNHFVRLEGADGSQAVINHQLYTTEQLTFKLDELFGRAFALEVTPVTAKTAAAATSIPAAAPVPPPTPPNKFCHNCGKKLNPEAAFCGNCGTKVK